MLNRVQDWAERVPLKRIASTNSSDRITSPEEMELFQTVRMPPEAPLEGTKANLSNRLVQQVLINARSINGFLISWTQTIEKPLVEIASETAKFFYPNWGCECSNTRCSNYTKGAWICRRSSQGSRALVGWSHWRICIFRLGGFRVVKEQHSFSDSSCGGIAQQWIRMSCRVGIGVRGSISVPP